MDRHPPGDRRDGHRAGAGRGFGTAGFTRDPVKVERIEREYKSLAAYTRETGAVVVSNGAEDVIFDGKDG